MAAPQPLKTTHPLMTCPVCREIIAANIQVQQVVGSPTITDLAAGAVSLPIEAKMVRFDVTHDCSGPAAAKDPGMEGA